LLRILGIIIDKNYERSKDIVGIILPYIENAIKLNNDNQIVKFVQIIQRTLAGNLKIPRDQLLLDNLIKYVLS
jgi:hypothetical protein